MKGLFVICSVLLATVQLARSAPIGTCVPGVIAYLPDDQDCSVFHRCELGTPIPAQCPPGLFFNPETWVCDWPEVVNCALSQLNADNEEESDDFLPQPLIDCPVLDGKYPVYTPDRVDCAKYYVCVHGEHVEFSCPEGLLYDGSYWACNYPEYVTCGVYTPLGDDGIPGSNDPNPPGEDGGSTPWVGECPEVVTTQLVLLASRNDPTKFYSCVGDTPYELSCPSGLVFNVNLQVCDYPQ